MSSVTRWGYRRGDGADQYYTFTARLAAGGYQRTVMRLLAVCILGLGLPAALGSAYARTTTLPGGRAGLVAIAVGCLILAVPWLRHRWPSRAESAAIVATGTLALCAGSLIPADPMSGLLVAVGFPFVLAYTALFHSVRLLVLPVAVSAVTIGILTVHVAIRKDPATAVAVTIPLVLLCGLITYGSRTIAVVGGSPRPPAEIDPVTGLLTRDSFDQSVATLLGARHRDDDRYLVVLAVGIDGFSAITGIHGSRGANQAQVDAGQAIREIARNGAIISHLGDARFLIADTFTTADPTPLVERALGAIAATPTGMTSSIGVMSTPLRPLAGRPPQDVIDKIIGLAATAMDRARAAGGNQARFVLGPMLSDDGLAEHADD